MSGRPTAAQIGDIVESLPKFINLFFYGSLNLEELASRTKLSVGVIRRNAWAANLQGCQRYFTKWSDKRHGAIATICPGTGEVNGIMLQVVHKNGKFYVGFESPNLHKFDMIAFCKTEAMHTGKYFLQQIQGLTYRQKTGDRLWVNPTSPVWTFVANSAFPCAKHPGLNRPSDEYIQAIQKMLLDRRELEGNARDSEHPPDIDIRLC